MEMKTKQGKKNLALIQTLLFLTLGVVGATLLTPKLLDIIGNVPILEEKEKPEYRLDAPSAVLPLANVAPADRQEALLKIANQDTPSLDRSRAKYLLAVDTIKEEFDGAKALSYLNNLEKQYPILAPYIILLRGRAYELTNDKVKAQEIWQQLIAEYPQDLVIPEAYFKLSQYQPSYGESAIAQFPQHPRTHNMIRESLKENPQQKDLLLVLAEYDLSGKSKPDLDRLVKEYGKELQPNQWDIIANNYWRNAHYLPAVEAYKKGTSTPENLYRIARGYEVSGKTKEAKISYLKFVNEFPDAQLTGLGWRRLANLATGDEALSYLNKVDDKFPQEAPKALSQKANLLTRLQRFPEATEARNLLLQKYPNSNEAANYRWQIAQDFAKNNNLISAWQWAQQISVYNPDSSIAPKAGFWVGKWAEKLGQTEEAIKAYEFVFDKYPHSYYAWRSAVRLGKDVGDFNTLRSLPLEVKLPENRPIPPAGSNMFKELFLLGKDGEAIDLFQAEIGNREELTVSEEFVQGLLKQNQGQYLQSINQIWNLSNRDKPEDLREWQILRKSPEYWYALFPIPYNDLIVKWSKERNLNPFLVASLMRQESRFEKDIKSPVGATGLMQIMPDTGKWIAPQINLKEYSLTDPNDNINMGTWYLNYTHETFNGNSMLAMASYNAGPGNVSNWISRFSLSDMDEFVENIPFGETKNYIETVFGNYWNYINLYNPEIKDKN